MNIGFFPDVLLSLVEPAVGENRAVDVDHVVGKYLGRESLTVIFCRLQNGRFLGLVLEHITEFIGTVYK